jgi:hypothetical protein
MINDAAKTKLTAARVVDGTRGIVGWYRDIVLAINGGWHRRLIEPWLR